MSRRVVAKSYRIGLKAALFAATLLPLSLLMPPALQAETQAAPTQSPAGKEVKADGISFVYSPQDFQEVQCKREEKVTAEDIGDGIDTGMAPEHVCCYLQDKRALPALDEGPRYFFPAESFICFYPLQDASIEDFATTYPSLQYAALQLRAILKKRPRRLSRRSEIPDLPPNNAGPSFISRFQHLNFRSGSGLLFLTQYANEMLPNPANNEELTLDFQGLTTDGRYYVAARLAITHPSLPRGIDFTDDIKRDKHWLYLRRAGIKLAKFPADSFQPTLNSLKDLLASIEVKAASKTKVRK